MTMMTTTTMTMMMKITCWAPPPAAALYLRALPVTSHSHPEEKKFSSCGNQAIVFRGNLSIAAHWMSSSQQCWSLKTISVVSAFCGLLRTIHTAHNINNIILNSPCNKSANIELVKLTSILWAGWRGEAKVWQDDIMLCLAVLQLRRGNRKSTLNFHLDLSNIAWISNLGKIVIAKKTSPEKNLFEESMIIPN